MSKLDEFWLFLRDPVFQELPVRELIRLRHVIEGVLDNRFGEAARDDEAGKRLRDELASWDSDTLVDASNDYLEKDLERWEEWRRALAAEVQSRART